MATKLVTNEHYVRGRKYEIWRDSAGNYLVAADSPDASLAIGPDDFDPPLSNAELLAVHDYGRDTG